ncbi:MAG: cupin domain-containing protein [Anaerolineae bacterium]|jgi:quercetin dioxygenase-like cupin family protein|nr:cupin domain-containing protein [Chloroflexota bacterium]
MHRVTIDKDAGVLSTLPIMVGDVYVQPLTEGYAETIRISSVSFPNGARNVMHSHQREQVLVILEGEGIVANEETELQVSAGDVIIIPAGEQHWHGARPDSSMVHLSIMA